MGNNGEEGQTKDTPVHTTARLSRQAPGRGTGGAQRARPSPRERRLPRHPEALSQAWLPRPPALPLRPHPPPPGSLSPGPRRARRAGRGCGGPGAGARRPPSPRRLWSVPREPPEPRHGEMLGQPGPRTDGARSSGNGARSQPQPEGEAGRRFRREGTRSPSRGRAAAQAGRCQRGPPPLAAGRRAVTDLSAGAW